MNNILFFLLFIVVFTESTAQKTLNRIGLNKAMETSDLNMVFEPGILLENEKVRKTFQPSYVVTSKGTLLVFCQGRLKFGNDNDPKVILMNKSFDFGLTWVGVEVLSSPMNFFAISPYSAIIDGKERISFITCVGLEVTKNTTIMILL